MILKDSVKGEEDHLPQRSPPWPKTTTLADRGHQTS